MNDLIEQLRKAWESYLETVPVPEHKTDGKYPYVPPAEQRVFDVVRRIVDAHKTAEASDQRAKRIQRAARRIASEKGIEVIE